MDVTPAVAAGALDALDAPAAVLDADGVVVAANGAWTAFEGLGSDAGPGTDYPAALADAGADAAVVRAVRSALDTDARADTECEAEYGSVVAEVRRRYRLVATPYTAGGERHVLVRHEDVTDRAALRDALRERDEALWASAAVLNHDLRNRFTVARGWLEMLSDDGTDGGDEGSDAKSRAAAAIDRADDAVVDAVAYQRVGRSGLDVEAVTVGTLAHAAWEALDGGADASLYVRDDTTVEADASLAADALGRVFENALAHAGADATVAVGSFDRDGERGFYVADDGPGIPVERREAVFSLGRTVVGGGTGYGLPVVARIAACHGWTVRATEADGGGARVEFVTAPRDPVPPVGWTDPRLTGSPR